MVARPRAESSASGSDSVARAIDTRSGVGWFDTASLSAAEASVGKDWVVAFPKLSQTPTSATWAAARRVLSTEALDAATLWTPPGTVPGPLARVVPAARALSADATMGENVVAKTARLTTHTKRATTATRADAVCGFGSTLGTRKIVELAIHHVVDGAHVVDVVGVNVASSAGRSYSTVTCAPSFVRVVDVRSSEIVRTSPSSGFISCPIAAGTIVYVRRSTQVGTATTSVTE